MLEWHIPLEETDLKADLFDKITQTDELAKAAENTLLRSSDKNFGPGGLGVHFFR